MSTAVVPMKKPSLIAVMASEHQMDPDKFAATIRATCMPQNASNEEFAAFLMVAHRHGLNPITREIYAFPKKGGGIQPIVGIDGWMTLINSHPNFDGMEFEDHFDKSGALTAITCRLYRKDRNRAVSVTEYMEECKRPTEPWQKWPARMLRHKAAIQAARYAFSFSGIIDPEEAERSPDVITGQVVAPPPPPAVEHKQEADALAAAKDMLDNIEDADELDSAWSNIDLSELTEDEADELQVHYYACLDRLDPNLTRAG